MAGSPEGPLPQDGEEHGRLQLPDDFWVLRYKIEQCTVADAHDWETCLFAHKGEKARRRHPSRYQALQCPEARTKRVCPRGDDCPCTHSLFEYWLHPDKFRTCMCEFGGDCKRRVCFFAHSREELRKPPNGAVVVDPLQQPAAVAAAGGGAFAPPAVAPVKAPGGGGARGSARGGGMLDPLLRLSAGLRDAARGAREDDLSFLGDQYGAGASSGSFTLGYGLGAAPSGGSYTLGTSSASFTALPTTSAGSFTYVPQPRSFSAATTVSGGITPRLLAASSALGLGGMRGDAGGMLDLQLLQHHQQQQQQQQQAAAAAAAAAAPDDLLSQQLGGMVLAEESYGPIAVDTSHLDYLTPEGAVDMGGSGGGTGAAARGRLGGNAGAYGALPPLGGGVGLGDATTQWPPAPFGAGGSGGVRGQGLAGAPRWAAASQLPGGVEGLDAQLRARSFDMCSVQAQAALLAEPQVMEAQAAAAAAGMRAKSFSFGQGMGGGAGAARAPSAAGSTGGSTVEGLAVGIMALNSDERRALLQHLLNLQ